MENFVYTGAAAVALGCSPSWIRHAIKIRVTDSDRWGGKGWYEIRLEQMLDLVVAKRMRELRIGYTTIRGVVDQVGFDEDEVVVVSFGTIVISVNRQRALSEAEAAMMVAKSLQYGAPYREATTRYDSAKSVGISPA